MKVRVSYVVHVSDAFRRKLRERYRLPGLATRSEIQAHYEVFGGTADVDRLWESSDDPERNG